MRGSSLKLIAALLCLCAAASCRPRANIEEVESGTSQQESASAGEPVDRPPRQERLGRIVLDDTMMQVEWLDGDTLRFVDGPEAGERARLQGYNTLEGYGPVHRWGAWSPEDLAAVGAEALQTAIVGTWECTDTGESGGYGRMLVHCENLLLTLVTAGMAMLDIESDEEPPGHWVYAQQLAQAAQDGIWHRGIPDGVVVGVHSTAEGHPQTSDRVISTETGRARRVRHRQAYEVCEEVCHDGSCMLYVPYERRFGDNRAPCL